MGRVCACACVSSPPDDSRENYRESICQTMKLLLRECMLTHLPQSLPPSCKQLISVQRSTINAFGTFCNPDHILEHSEDDTKSLFVIIKVSPSFDFVYYSCELALTFRPGASPALWKVSPLPFPCLFFRLSRRSSATSCFSKAPTRRSSTRVGRASHSSRSPWRTG